MWIEQLKDLVARERLTREQMEVVTRRQLATLAAFGEVPTEGVELTYHGLNLSAWSNVFQPFGDTEGLARSIVIERGEMALDVGCGIGNLTLLMASKGARRSVGLDCNMRAVQCARANIERLGYSDRVEVRYSKTLSRLGPGERFNVVTVNLPFRDRPAASVIAQAMYDPGLASMHAFFRDIRGHLHPEARVYYNQGNFGEAGTMLDLAEETGFAVELLNRHQPDTNDPRVFYAFELR